jgi:predicted kinase
MDLAQHYRQLLHYDEWANREVVETLRSRENEVEGREREAAIALARKYFTLACGYATETVPAIIVMCGLSGTGKSTIAKAVQHRFGFPIISSDLMRKKLMLVPVDRSTVDAYRSGIYALPYVEKIYAAMFENAEHLLRDSTGVILDATFQDPAYRDAARKLAEQMKVPILFIECRAEDAEIRRRLIQRQKQANNPSDATVGIYLRQLEDFVALTEIPPSAHLIVDTARPRSEIVVEVRNAMERLRKS